jgi:hypothetical protein
MNIKLTSVRLSFPSLFKPRAFEEGQEPKFSATFILDKVKDAAQIATVQAAIAAVIHEEWKGKVTLAHLKGTCIRDGGEGTKTDVDGYGPTVMFVTSSSSKRIPVVDRDLTPLTEQDSKPYAGCYVNCSLRLWAQDNKFGKRVNAQLRAIQFVKDGDAFGDKLADVEKEFAPLADDPASML